MAEGQTSFVAGLAIPQRSDDAASLLQLARADGYDFVTTSLPACGADTNEPSSAPPPPPRRDVTALESKWWSTSVVGAVADPPDFVDLAPIPPPHAGADDPMAVDGATDGGAAAARENHGRGLVAALCGASAPSLARSAERRIASMVEWAGHMSIPAVILPPIPSDPRRAAHYARLLSTVAPKSGAANVQLWVRTGLGGEALEAFDLLHRRCDGASNLGCLLCFDAGGTLPGAAAVAVPPPTGPGGATPPPPSSSAAGNVGKSMALIHRFVGSNLRAVSFSTSVFLTNKRGYPTLSKSHQVLFTELLRRLGRTLRVMVEGNPVHRPPPPPGSSPSPGAPGAAPGTGTGGGAPGAPPPSNPASSAPQPLGTEAAGRTGCLAYLQYLRHLRTRAEVSDVLDTEESAMESSYLDHLQSPLQPLGDNLEFQTYETFERDPVKYLRYGVAVQLAVRDMLSMGKLAKRSTPEGREVYEVVILVVGAGRGPLIRAALEAVENVNDSLTADAGAVVPRIVGVEKNASAVLYLRSLKAREPRWGGDAVTIVECDMRRADTNPTLRAMKSDESQRADLLVSELLGSFGDNELSPECLDGVQDCGLLKANCVSIPQRYTSYIAPISSMRLHSEAAAQAYSPANPTDGPAGKPCGTLQAMETPYVVRSHAACQTHVELPCWEFVHPRPQKAKKEEAGKAALDGDASGSGGDPSDNERSVHVVFTPDATHGAGCGPGYGPFDAAVAAMSSSAAAQAAAQAQAASSSEEEAGGGGGGGITVHGFLGTFHSTLYQSPLSEKDASVISIAPSSFSVGMFSWFPLYFPLREPLRVPRGGSVGLTMWRRNDAGSAVGGGRVWYEWCAEVYASGGGHGGGSPVEEGGHNGAAAAPVRVLSASPVHNPNGRSYHVRL